MGYKASYRSFVDNHSAFTPPASALPASYQGYHIRPSSNSERGTLFRRGTYNDKFGYLSLSKAGRLGAIGMNDGNSGGNAGSSSFGNKIWGLKVIDCRILFTIKIRDVLFSYVARCLDHVSTVDDNASTQGEGGEKKERTRTDSGNGGDGAGGGGDLSSEIARSRSSTTDGGGDLTSHMMLLQSQQPASQGRRPSTIQLGAAKNKPEKATLLDFLEVNEDFVQPTPTKQASLLMKKQQGPIKKPAFDPHQPSSSQHHLASTRSAPSMLGMIQETKGESLKGETSPLGGGEGAGRTYSNDDNFSLQSDMHEVTSVTKHFMVHRSDSTDTAIPPPPVVTPPYLSSSALVNNRNNSSNRGSVYSDEIEGGAYGGEDGEEGEEDFPEIEGWSDNLRSQRLNTRKFQTGGRGLRRQSGSNAMSRTKRLSFHGKADGSGGKNLLFDSSHDDEEGKSKEEGKETSQHSQLPYDPVNRFKNLTIDVPPGTVRDASGTPSSFTDNNTPFSGGMTTRGSGMSTFFGPGMTRTPSEFTGGQQQPSRRFTIRAPVKKVPINQQFFRVELIDPQINFLDASKHGSLIIVAGTSSVEGKKLNTAILPPPSQQQQQTAAEAAEGKPCSYLV
jgi:hypothetical protein